MADPVIVWTVHPDDSNTHVGKVNDVQYFLIYPRYGWSNHMLASAIPMEQGVEPTGDVEDLKDLATDFLAKFLTMAHAQMVVMGLLTE